MKKNLTVLMMVLLVAMLFISCDNSTSEPTTTPSEPTTTPSEPTTTPSEPTSSPLKKTCTVTFNTGEGGSKVDSQEVAKNGTAKKPTDPTKDGYYLAAWNTADNKKFNFTNDKVTADITLTAVWKKVYTVGEAGPAGGTVFYDVDADNDKGNGDGLTAYDCGWRYLEAAPADLPSNYVFGYYRDNSVYNSTVGTETAIGTGKSNTEALVEKMGNETYSESSGTDKTSYAAKACSDYGNNTAYHDWFLPSKDELNQMYTNLKSQSKGNNWSDSYWSSSESDNGNAWQQKFETGNPYKDDRKWKKNVRPVRAF